MITRLAASAERPGECSGAPAERLPGEVLLEQLADPNARNRTGWKPLMVAANMGLVTCCAALVRGGLASLESLSLANNPADEEAAKAVVEVLSKRRGETATPLPSAAPVNEFSRIMGTSLYG